MSLLSVFKLLHLFVWTSGIGKLFTTIVSKYMFPLAVRIFLNFMPQWGET